jgi:hypothetical protein
VEKSAGPLLSKSGDLKAVASFIGWLAGSLSGIVAIMYGAGFLSVHAHLDMLGLNFVSTVPNTVYLQNGAKFFYLSTIMLTENIFFLVVDALPLFILAFGATALVAAVILFAASGFHIGKALKTVRNFFSRFGRPEDTGPKAGHWLRPLILIAVLLWGWRQYPVFFAPIQLSNLLYQTCEQSSPLPESQDLVRSLTCKILEDDRSAVQKFYGGLLNQTMILFLFAVVLRKLFFQALILKILYAPLLLLFSICFLVLPITYGKLVISNEYPLIRLEKKSESKTEIPEGPFFMISQEDKQLVLWHPANKTAFMIHPSEVTAIEMLERVSVFTLRKTQGMQPKEMKE